MPVEVQFAASPPDPLRAADLEGWAEAVIERMREAPEAVEVCIRVVDAAESRQLNSSFRGQDRPTNVLSFPADVEIPEAEEGTDRILGDIVICDPVVRREAQTQNKSVHDHYAHMVVHGMLHLYGHDHVDPDEAEAMEDTEREILGELDIIDPYRIR